MAGRSWLNHVVLFAIASVLCVAIGCDLSTRIAHQETASSVSTRDDRILASSNCATIILADKRKGSGISFPLKLPDSRPVGIKETIGHGAAMLDADGDGWLDILLTGPNRVALYRNGGDWNFEWVANTGFRQQGYWQGVAVGDINHDALPDIFLSGFGCSALYLNRGSNRFDDITSTSGLAAISADRWQTSAAFADIDCDGDLDLYVTCYVDLAGKSGCCTYPGGVLTACNPLRFEPQRGILYCNLNDGRFETATSAFQLDKAHGNGLGVAFCDPDSDGYPDLYLANDQRPCDLFVSEQGRAFREFGERSGTAFQWNGAPQSGMGVDVADYDNDGRSDLVVTNFLHEPTSLYHNEGELIFSNNTLTSRLGPATTSTVGWGVKWVDLDNDGWLDLVVANGHPLHHIKALDGTTEAQQKVQVFHNQRDQSFSEVMSFGDASIGVLAGRALCIGDLNNDGRVDLLVSNIEGEPLLLHNATKTENHWLSVRLVHPAVIEGTRVIARAGKQQWLRYCTTGGSYLSASDSRVHFGLGSLSVIETLEVHWPNGSVTKCENVKADQEIVVRVSAASPSS